MSEAKPPIVVFCERLENESFCAAVVRELGAWYEVRACGPGWPAADLPGVDPQGVRFYLELDAASGSFVRPHGLERLAVPKFAWLIDTHKKPGFHRQLSEDMDLTFHAMPTWGHVLGGRTAWLPVHCDQELFRPQEAEREWDVVFVGSQPWRADALRRIADRHGLRLLVTCTTGPREKSETAAIYARSKVVFNRHVTNDLNFRVVEAMACGRAVLTDAQWNGQYELFRDEDHYLLYKDEPDLERQLLRLLADDGLRARIEREAAALAHAAHTTRVRTGQLRGAIEAFLRERHARVPELAVPASSPEEGQDEPGPASPPRRFLVLGGPTPPTVEQRSYAELCARALSRQGHEVVLVRSGLESPLFEPARAAPEEPREVWLDPGPLPARTGSDLRVEPAAAVIAGLNRLVVKEGRFDAVLAEGALGALVAPFVAEAHGVPFFFALTTCEVERRGNRLTREQLYQAELEQWGCDHADLVIAPDQRTADAARRHYRIDHVVAAAPGRRPCPASSAEALRAYLGLGPRPWLLLAPDLSASDAERLLDPPELELDHDVVLIARETWWRPARGGVEQLARTQAAGPALAALLSQACAVVGLQPEDPRLEEARLMGAEVVCPPGEPRELRVLLELARQGQAQASTVDAPRQDRALVAALIRSLERAEATGAVR